MSSSALPFLQLRSASCRFEKQYLALSALVCIAVLCLAPARGYSQDNVTVKREVIRVGGNSAYPPYEFLDKNGKPAGFVVDLVQAIARVMGFDVEITLGESWTDMRKALEDGRVDILEGISYSEARAKILDFSVPHSYVSHSIFARKGVPPVKSFDELRGRDVVLMGRGVMHDYFVQTDFPIHPVNAPTVKDAIEMLASGQYDYAVLATLPGNYIIRDLGVTNVEMDAKSVQTEKYCFAVKKGNNITLSKFNEGLALLTRTGTYKDLQDKWLGAVETPPIPYPLSLIAKHSLIIFGTLFLGLCVTFIWSRALKRQVGIRTAALEHEMEERKRSTEELKLHHQQLVQADKMAALGVLVSGMAHEINNPNGLILLNLPVIQETMKDIEPILESHFNDHGDFKAGGLAYSRLRQEMPYIIDETQDAAKRIKRIVDDLRHFSKKSDSDLIELVDLNGIVQTALRLVENSMRRSAIHCNVDYTEPIPHVKGNSHRLEQVVVNLLVNACQAIESNGMATLDVKVANSNSIDAGLDSGMSNRGIFITTGYEQQTGYVIVKVRDEGIGIPPEHISRLTDPFFTTKRDTGGTGLGLAISSEIVREHDGMISFESMPGEGATVIMMLPAISGDET